MTGLIRYLSELKPGKTVLWCYLIWYLVVVYFYFDPSPKIWINAIGISIVIGTGLVLSVASGKGKSDRWQTFRLYLMPFCVSSFSALIKDKGFFVVFPSNFGELGIAIACCILFLSIVLTVKFIINQNLKDLKE